MPQRSTRERLLAAALTEFDLSGYEATTVANICQRAGISNGSFFHAFPSKEAVAGAVFLSALQAYHEALIEAAAPGTSATHGIAALVAAHVEWVVGNKLQARFMFVHAPSMSGAAIRAEQAALNKKLQKALVVWCEPNMRQGTLHALPVEVFACQVIGPAQMFCRAWLSGRKRERPDAHLPELIACAVRAVSSNSHGNGRRLQLTLE